MMPERKSGFELNDPSRMASNIAAQYNTPDESPCEKIHRTSGHRVGEVIVAVPEPEISQKRVMTEEEINHYAEIDTTRENERIKALEEQLVLESGGLQLPDWMRNFCMWGLVSIAAILLLLVIGQITNFLAQFNSIPVWSQWVIGILLVLLVGVILYLIFKLGILFLKLNKNEQINLTAIDALQKREALRHLAKKSSNEAIGQLKIYLEDFPIESKKLFIGLGFNDNEIDQLIEARNKLIKDEVGENYQRWIKLYSSGFQSTLDEIAHRRIRAYALKTALKTAISPLPILDTVIVLTLSLSLVRDLMTLYNLKMNAAGAGKILLHAIGQVYLAGHLQELSAGLADFLTESIGDNLGQVTASVGNIVGSKAGEGIANGLMIYRLGKATAELLQPTC